MQQAFAFLAASRGATRFLVVGLCSGANYGIQTAFMEPRVDAVLAIDPSVARTRRSTIVHFARRLKHMATMREFIAFRHPIFRRTLGDRRSMAAAQAAAGQSERRVEIAAATTASLANVTTELNRTMDRGMRLMLVFTGGVNHMYNYQKQLFDLLPDVDFRDLLTLRYMPETDHTVSDLDSRRELMADVTAWLMMVFTEARHPAEQGLALVPSERRS